MSGRRLILAMAMGILIASQAGAITLSSNDGTWSNVIGGGGTVDFINGVSLSYGNGSENQVRWGQSLGFGQSGLGFTGATPPPLTFGVGEAFQVGQLQHFNVPTAAATKVDSVDLTVNMTFSDPAGTAEPFTFTLEVDETPNTGAGSPEDDDFILFPSGFPNQTFEIDGTLFTLELLGFGSSPDTIVPVFQSPEGMTNATLLWGTVTASLVNVIPAPGAVLLGMIGAGFVGWLRQRRTL